MYQPIDVDRFRSPGPAAWHSLTELPRVLLELSTLLYLWPLLGAAPRGDGHPVLVLPGFTAGDESTVMLRRYLARLGYTPLPWNLGRNTGSFDLQERLISHFRRLVQQSPSPVSIIGQSLGGVFARELARQFPEHVRIAITLGSPISSNTPETANGTVARLFRYMSGMTHEEMRDQMLRYPPEPPPVPCSAIYSKSDGVVHWSSCLEYPGAQAENIEVIASHTGMAMNPVVYHVIADRLAQAPGEWKPFERRRGWRPFVYPPSDPENREVAACAN